MISLTKFISKLKHKVKRITDTTYATLEDEGKDLIARTKILTPVDTGRLKSSWEYEVIKEGKNNYKLLVHNDARNPEYGMKYGKFVEYGHYSPTGNWVEGRFMLTRSLPQTEENLKKKLKSRIAATITNDM